MHYAAEREDEKMVKVLLARGGVWNAGESPRGSWEREGGVRRVDSEG